MKVYVMLESTGSGFLEWKKVEGVFPSHEAAVQYAEDNCDGLIWNDEDGEGKWEGSYELPMNQFPILIEIEEHIVG